MGYMADMPEMTECILSCQKGPLPLSSIGRYILGWGEIKNHPLPPFLPLYLLPYSQLLQL